MKKFKILILIVLCLIFLLSSCSSKPIYKTTATYFDGQVIVERVRNRAFIDDKITFVFTEKGQYDIAFYRTEIDSACVPENISLNVTDVPRILVISRYDLPKHFRISITKGEIAETHDMSPNDTP